MMRFEDMLVAWQALKMTLAILPGICLITWAGYAGWTRKRPRASDLAAIWAEIREAKSEGLKEFARWFLPLCPPLGYILLTAALFLIPCDTTLLHVVNVCALPAALVSYREGRRTGRFRRESADWHDFDLPWRSLLKVLGFWLGTAASVFGGMRALGR